MPLQAYGAVPYGGGGGYPVAAYGAYPYGSGMPVMAAAMQPAAVSAVPDDARSHQSRRSRHTSRSRRSRRSRSGERRSSQRERRRSEQSERTSRSKSSGQTRLTRNPGRFGTKANDGHGVAGFVKYGLDGQSKRREGKRLAVKRLGKVALSHEEEHIDGKNLDYTPITVHLPVDLLYPTRMRRRMDADDTKSIELLTCIHVEGNTNPRDLSHTLSALANSLQLLKDRTEIGWAELGVVVLIDGRAHMSEELKQYLSSELRLYDESMLDLAFDGRETTVHLFERSVELPKHQTQRSYHKPLQLSLAVKEMAGAGELTSHQWFFMAFCTQLQPQYVLLLRPGVKPKPGAVSRLILALDRDPHLAGVTGDVTVSGFQWYNPWHAMAGFEQSLTAVLERPLEALVGYLPSTSSRFTAYRWNAIRGVPVSQYLLPEDEDNEMGPAAANRWLAPDRVMNLEVVAKKRRSWRIGYESLAAADALFPLDFPGMLEDKRREINGRLFNDLAFIMQCPLKVCCESNHGCCMRSCLTMMWFERLLLLLWRWLFLGSLFLTFNIIAQTILDAIEGIGNGLAFAFLVLYTILVMIQVMAGLGADPIRVRLLYWLSTVGFALMSFFAFIMIGYFIISPQFNFFANDTVRFVSFALAGAVALTSVVHCKVHILLLALLPSLLLLPTFVSVFPIYAITRLNNASWNVREDRLAQSQARPEDVRRARAARRQEQISRLAAEVGGGAEVSDEEVEFSDDEDGDAGRGAAPKTGPRRSNAGRRSNSGASAGPGRRRSAGAAGHVLAEATSGDMGDLGSRDESPGAGVGVAVMGTVSAPPAMGPSDSKTTPDGRGSDEDNEPDDSTVVASEAGDFVGTLRGGRTPGQVDEDAETVDPDSDVVTEEVEIPNDVALVVDACRNRTAFDAHRAVMDALRAEGERVRSVERRARDAHEETLAAFSAFRTQLLGLYMAMNFIWIALIIQYSATLRPAFVYGTAGLLGVLMLIRFIASLLYALGQCITGCMGCLGSIFCCLGCCRSIATACAPCCICCLWCVRPVVGDDYQGVEMSGPEGDLRQRDDGYDDELPTEGDAIAPSGGVAAGARISPGVAGAPSPPRHIPAPPARNRRKSVVQLSGANVPTAKTMQEGLAANRRAMLGATGSVGPGSPDEEMGDLSHADLQRALRTGNMRRSESGTDLRFLSAFKAKSSGGTTPGGTAASRPNVAGGFTVPRIAEERAASIPGVSGIAETAEEDRGEEDGEDGEQSSDEETEESSEEEVSVVGDGKAAPYVPPVASGVSGIDASSGRWFSAVPGRAAAAAAAAPVGGGLDLEEAGGVPSGTESSPHRQ